MKKKIHVALLKGGLSSEREVSLSSAKGIKAALDKLGYKVTEIDVTRNIANDLQEIKPDIAFNALHGTYGEDGCIQGVLEFLGIPYTHSGVRASSVGMDKPLAKYIFAGCGILCPEGQVADIEDILKKDIMPRPYVLKPISEGSSVGVVIVNHQNRIEREWLLPNHKQYIIEKYIPGLELSCAVLDGQALGVIEVKPKQGFYDYTNKYTDNKSDHIMPAQIANDVYEQVKLVSEKAYKILGCRGVARADFRYDHEGDGQVYLLEINTHPGMTPLSLVPEIARYVGIEFEEIIDRLVKGARCEN